MVVVPDFLWWGALFAIGVAVIALGWRAKRKRSAAAAGGAAVLVAAVVFAWFVRYDAVVVEDDGAGARGTRVYVLGEPDHPAEWSYGTKHPVWILNHSSHNIYLQLLERDPGPYGPARPTKIPPGGVDVDEAVDGFGYGDERPPVDARPRNGYLWLEWARPK